jgi:hypothetical protein
MQYRAGWGTYCVASFISLFIFVMPAGKTDGERYIIG